MNAYLRRSGYGRYLGLLFNMADVLILNLMFGAARWLCPDLDASDSKMMWVLVNVSYLVVLIRKRDNTHKNRAILLDRVAADSFLEIGVHALSFIALTEILSDARIPLSFYLVYYALVVLAMPLCDILMRRMVKRYRRRGRNYIRTVIVGTNHTSERLLQELRSDAGFGYRFLGFCGPPCPPDFSGSDQYIGDINMLADFVNEHHVDHIYYTLPGPAADEMRTVVKIADDSSAEFFYVPQVQSSLGRGFTLRSIGSMPILAARENPLKSPFNRMVKRGFDLVVSSLFLVTVYPLIYIPVAIAIKLTSPGPVYFRQQRTGYRGESFNCLKFRTMHVNKSADTCQATKDDPRKTRLGDFLRRTSLDELPQFINVWRGDMSIVGPRPHMLKHTEDYSKLIDRYMIRHLVKPGITGWAQVNGYRGITDRLWKMERRVEYDVWYIENWTFLLDLKIMVRTVINAFKGESNAY